MRIWFARIDPKTHRFIVERPPHDPIDVVLETRSMLLHDFAHYAVETDMQTEDGFYGWVARGLSPEALLEPERLGTDAAGTLMAIERTVAMNQSAFKHGREVSAPGALERLRRLNGAWKKAKQGEAVMVTWPNPDPQVVPLDGVIPSKFRSN